MGKMSAEEFVSISKINWQCRFPLVKGFMDWARENGYWELSEVSNLRDVQNRYRENMLSGKGEDGKPQFDENKRYIDIYGPIGWTFANAPKELEASIYGLTRKLVRAQRNKKSFEAKFMITGINGIAQSAFFSIMGLTDATYMESTDYRVLVFRESYQSWPTDPDTLTSFKHVAPMVRIVDAVLSNPNIPEDELRALLVVEEEEPTIEEEEPTIEETEPIEPEKTEISLTCESCNSSDVYDVSVLRTFGSVRCKGCGTRITAPKK